MDAWFFVRNQAAEGPVSLEGLVQLALQGVVTDSTLVWSQGASWEPFGAHEELREARREAEARAPGGLHPLVGFSCTGTRAMKRPSLAT